jgi:signal transduction histidine kinase/CheY-like chemotaxis protein
VQVNVQNTSFYNQNDRPSGYDFYSRVLLIEDNIGDARLVELLLEESDTIDCEIVNKTSLAEGMAALEEESFDAILLDLSLPDSRGFETLEKFMSRFPDENVIVLTGLKDKKLGIDAVRAGAQDYLVKGGFDSDWLAKALRYSIERNRFLKRLEEAQKIAKVGHWGYNLASKEFTASDEIYRILGYAPRSNDFHSSNIINPESHLFFLNGIIELTMNSGLHKSDYVIKQENGDEKSVFIQTNLTKNSKGDIISVHGIIQDVTNRKLREQLQKDHDLAVESAKIKERLLTRVSHEMRTPMNAILGMSNLVLKTELDEEQTGLVEGIQQNSEHLLGIINDILEISTLQNGKLKFEHKPFDLASLLSNLFNIVQYRLKESFIQFELDIRENVPKYVDGDPNRLHQVLINLVGNAFKFTEKGVVRVIVENINNEGDKIWLKFSVSDTGIGIPEDKVGDIFEPFNRIEYKEKNFEGTGLGLSIAHNIVAMQDGSMGVFSTVGEGSTFHFELPFAKAAQTSPVKENNTPVIIHTSRLIKLLLAEDNKFNQIVAKKTIEKEYSNIKVTIAQNGSEAVEMLKKNDFDIILMDLQMPVMDGYEATEYIRECLDETKSGITILAMTADAQIAKDGKFRKYKMDDYVLKPFRPEQLFEKLAHYINQNEEKK